MNHPMTYYRSQVVNAHLWRPTDEKLINRTVTYAVMKARSTRNKKNQRKWKTRIKQYEQDLKELKLTKLIQGE